MLKQGVIWTVIFVFLVSLTGCATFGKKNNLEAQGLKNEISALEAQIQSKDEEITSLKEELERIAAEKEASEAQRLQKTEAKPARKKVIGEIKSRPNTKQVQIALLNAGYDPGSLDGQMGKQTRDAIKDFQRAHNLSVDGKVGKSTWKKLREYLYKKVK